MSRPQTEVPSPDGVAAGGGDCGWGSRFHHARYDNAGQLTSVTDPLNRTTRYGYDATGNITAVTDAAGRVTQYEYDYLGNLIRRRSPSGALENFEHDADGNVIRRIDPNGKVTSFVYDSMGQMTSKQPDASFGAGAIRFTYTPTGERLTMQDPLGTTTYRYDRHGRRVSKATPIGTLDYGYDPAHNVTSIRSSNANGVSLTYSYDAADNLVSAIDAKLGTTQYLFNGNGFLRRTSYPNGMVSELNYDAVNRVTSAPISARPGVVARFAYAYDGAGEMASASDLTGRQVSYGYDTASRLVSEMYSGSATASANGTLSYLFDLAGNRLSRTSTVAAIVSSAHTYDADDRLQPDTYDANGNTRSTAGLTLQYNFEDQLVNANNGAVTMTYDGDGNRVAKTENGTETRYLVDDLNPTGLPQVLEEVEQGQVRRTYAYGWERIGQARAQGSAWVPSFYGYDANGSVRLLTDAAGDVTDTYEYDSYGNLILATGSTPNVYRWNGEAYDGALGMYHMRARHYGPHSGRFLTADPYGGDEEEPASLHRYMFGEANPVRFSDPLGLAKVTAQVRNYKTLTNNRNRRIAKLTRNKIRRVPQTTFDATCVFTKAWSTLDTTLVFQGIPSSMKHIADWLCQIRCTLGRGRNGARVTAMGTPGDTVYGSTGGGRGGKRRSPPRGSHRGETNKTRHGRDQHMKWSFPRGAINNDRPRTRVNLTNGRIGIPDGIDRAAKIVYELKPCRPGTLNRGMCQALRYADGLGRVPGSDGRWSARVVCYPPID